MPKRCNLERGVVLCRFGCSIDLGIGNDGMGLEEKSRMVWIRGLNCGFVDGDIVVATIHAILGNLEIPDRLHALSGKSGGPCTIRNTADTLCRSDGNEGFVDAKQ